MILIRDNEHSWRHVTTDFHTISIDEENTLRMLDAAYHVGWDDGYDKGVDNSDERADERADERIYDLEEALAARENEIDRLNHELDELLVEQRERERQV